MRAPTIEDRIEQAVTEAVERALEKYEASLALVAGPKLVYDRHEAAELLSCSPQTVDRMGREGRLEFIEGVGRGRTYPRDALLDFIRRQRQRA